MKLIVQLAELETFLEKEAVDMSTPKPSTNPSQELLRILTQGTLWNAKIFPMWGGVGGAAAQNGTLVEVLPGVSSAPAARTDPDPPTANEKHNLTSSVREY